MAIRNPNADESIKEYDELQTAELNGIGEKYFQKKSVKIYTGTLSGTTGVINVPETERNFTIINSEVQASNGNWVGQGFTTSYRTSTGNQITVVIDSFYSNRPFRVVTIQI